MNDPAGPLRRIDQTGVPLLVARLILGGMFIYLGCMKLRDPVAFLKLIREYHMVPDAAPMLLNLIAATLPWIEILCGVLLLIGTALRGTGSLLAFMLIGFTGAVALRAIRLFHDGTIAFCAIKFDCGCGTGEVFICNKLLENTGLLALALVVIGSRSRRWSLRGDLLPTRSPAAGTGDAPPTQR